MAYYITGITKQLFCCVLDSQEVIKFSVSFKLNEIHKVDSPFNEDPKNLIFFTKALILGEGWPEN